MSNTYQEAIENSNIVSKTDINGIITFVNDEFCKISGYSYDELIGQNHNIVRHPEVPTSNFETLWNTILSKKLILKGEIKMKPEIKKRIEDYVMDEFDNLETLDSTEDGYYSARGSIVLS